MGFTMTALTTLSPGQKTRMRKGRLVRNLTDVQGHGIVAAWAREFATGGAPAYMQSLHHQPLEVLCGILNNTAKKLAVCYSYMLTSGCSVTASSKSHLLAAACAAIMVSYALLWPRMLAHRHLGKCLQSIFMLDQIP